MRSVEDDLLDEVVQVFDSRIAQIRALDLPDDEMRRMLLRAVAHDLFERAKESDPANS